MIARSKHQFSRIVIFLDFDGVLHSKFSGSFDLMPNFFRVLEEFPCAMVVISSDWREELTDRDYIQLFGQYHSRIIGITPRIKFARREIEILQYVKNAQISQFIAIDDDCRDELFSYKCPWLFNKKIES